MYECTGKSPLFLLCEENEPRVIASIVEGQKERMEELDDKQHANSAPEAPKEACAPRLQQFIFWGMFYDEQHNCALQLNSLRAPTELFAVFVWPPPRRPT